MLLWLIIGGVLLARSEDPDGPLEVTLLSFLCMKCKMHHTEGQTLFHDHRPHCFKMKKLDPFEGVIRAHQRAVAEVPN